jgi:hypothetical protein
VGGAEGGRVVFMVVEKAARPVHGAFPDREAAIPGGADRRTEITLLNNFDKQVLLIFFI